MPPAAFAFEDAVRWRWRELALLDLDPSSGSRTAALFALGDALVAAGDLDDARGAYVGAARLAHTRPP